MQDQIESLSVKALAELDEVDGPDKLEQWRVHYLGRKSELVQYLRSLSDVPIEQRRVIGARANEIKQNFEEKLQEKKLVLEKGLLNALHEKRLDVTMPGKQVPLGRLHITTQIINEICDVFRDMGFKVAEGPEVEWEYYNFEALNMPIGHPARDNFQTLWVDSDANRSGNSMLLRTHTSPVQIRVMEKTAPPIRIVAPGKAYRYEATDATHEWMFHQVEGLAVDKNITMADLKGTLFEFARRLFGRDRKFRFRVDYFTFVDPGGELAIDCFMCKGAGCRLCSYSGWLEILGCGMVHPEVLRYGNVDPDIYSGYAFGMGVERVAILRYGIEDIRLFYSNDLRFLKQF
jgi:phenylalanyl-tRNA synthetase alpha chain